MKLTGKVKPISYLKANASEVIRTVAEDGKPLIITLNGEAKAVVQDIASYEQTQETLALLKILALGKQQVEEGAHSPAKEVLKRFRGKKRDRK